MDLNLIKKLVKIFNSSDISELEVEKEGLRVKIGKQIEQVNIPSNTIVSAPTNSQPNVEGTKTETEYKKVEVSNSENLHEIHSPIVGTFYRSPSPDSDPYVKVGDSITKGSVLCIVEAMKLMNEIESDVNGKIVKIIVDDGNPVEYNQPLFLIETS
ncbi:MAG: acetyl-CoA carboxylase, biotin carboxyl carrier protein [Ignavibacteriales bacterium CG12_big_fil_rev_8_21_14_0_65_30_8]|nr:MAG: acetyl-CoA carboxylase, biotin carboxyl carrier protein [Ignavibacteriales bacterium CG12_big_fil_rev_8_21_14_0_65_30_8]